MLYQHALISYISLYYGTKFGSFNHIYHCKCKISETVAPKCSMENEILENVTKFTEKHLCRSLFSALQSSSLRKA